MSTMLKPSYFRALKNGTWGVLYPNLKGLRRYLQNVLKFSD